MSLAETITKAPADTNVLVVFKPIPVLPPVTIAIFPVRSISFIISVAVDFALKPLPKAFYQAP